MPVKITQEELAKHLAEQIGFLQSSAKLYDLGNETEAKRMAVTLRVLLHDTKTSSSLLGQMHLKKKMQFVSTARKYDPTNLLSQQCLLCFTLIAMSLDTSQSSKMTTTIAFCPSQAGAARSCSRIKRRIFTAASKC